MDGRGHLAGATGSAACLAKAGSYLLLIGQYDSEFKLRNGVSQAGATFYASGTTSDGTIEVFALNTSSADKSVLEPLTQFGFTIEKAPPFGS